LDFWAVLVKLAHLGWGYLNAPILTVRMILNALHRQRVNAHAIRP
jgi:hypothetical protein